jgi:hypothetical protein
MSTGSGDSDERDERDETPSEKQEPEPLRANESAKARKPWTLGSVLRSNAPRVRTGLAIACGGGLALVVAFAACGGCGRRQAATSGDAATKASGSAESVAPRAAFGDASASPRDSTLWANARDGDPEDLATLAAHEGAAGLVEAASDASLRATAIRAMGYARGWSQLPFLSRAAGGKDDNEARLALDATIDLAARARTSEDPEDAEELREGCETLLALARDAARARPRRVAAVRALRMMPCAKTELPTDVDAK